MAREFVTYDLEFIDDGTTIDLVSIGMKSGDGRTLYAVHRNFNQDALLSNHWMRKHVWPGLPIDRSELQEGTGRGVGRLFPRNMCMCRKDENGEYSCTHWNGKLDKDHPDVRPMGQIRRMVSDFLLACHPIQPARHRDEIQMWAYYGAYDHVRLAQIFGPMLSLPSHVPMITHDLKSEMMRLGVDSADMPSQKGRAHNALADAEGNHQKAMFLWELATGKKGDA